MIKPDMNKIIDNDGYTMVMNNKKNRNKHNPHIRCGCIVINYDAKTLNHTIIIVKGRCSQKYSFPKGHIEQHEEIYECALRELREEVGNNIIKIFNKNGINEKNMLRIKISSHAYYFICILDKNKINLSNIVFTTRDKQEISSVDVITFDIYKKYIENNTCNLDMRLFYKFYVSKMDNVLDITTSSKLSIKNYYERIKKCVNDSHKYPFNDIYKNIKLIK
jgi:ADP-ribose pyrophosphatase YjhB (NUDIX family)